MSARAKLGLLAAALVAAPPTAPLAPALHPVRPVRTGPKGAESSGTTSVLSRPARRRKPGSSGPAGATAPGDGGSGSEPPDDGFDPFGGGDPGEPPGPFSGIGRLELGFGLFLMGITTLFAIFLAAWVRLRAQSEIWPPPGAPRAPRGLWISTLVLAATSALLQRAVAARRRGDGHAMTHRLALGLVLGAAFLGVQVFLWRGLVAEGFQIAGNAYGQLFYGLTGLHALHVLGGVAFLLCTLPRARRLALLEVRTTAVELCALYWHFMGAIWLVLFAAFYLAA